MIVSVNIFKYTVNSNLLELNAEMDIKPYMLH